MKISCRIEFEKQKILMVVDRANIQGLRRAGAYIRKAARNKVKTSPSASMPNSPPNTRRGLLKNSLLFGVEKHKKSVVVGPAEKFIGQSMKAHEYGGIYRKRRYPKRPLMQPTLIQTAKKIPSLWDKTVKK